MSRALPSLWLMAATLAAMLPWHLGVEARFLQPLAVAIVVVLATTRRADALPVFLVLAAGIAYDGVTQGPLGFWALVLLAALGFAQLLGPVARGAVGRLAAGIVAVAGVCAFHWILASLYQLDRLPLAPHARTAAVAIIVLSLASLFLDARSHARPGRAGGLKLERGA